MQEDAIDTTDTSQPADTISAAEQDQTAHADAQTDPAGEQQTQEEQGEQQQQRDEKGRFKGVQNRIDELTRARHEAEREAAYWRSRASGGDGQDKAQPNSATPAAPAKPTPDQYEDYGDYIEALTDWKTEQKLNQHHQAEAQRKQTDVRVQTFAERQNAARQSMPDYDTVLQAADVQVAQHVADVILDSENGPGLAYHLAKNPDEAARINALPPLAAARELGRLEAAISTAKPTPAASDRSVSKAPAPITPVNSGRSTEQDLSKIGMDEYMQRRKAQGARWAR